MRDTDADKAAIAHLEPVEPDFISQNADLTVEAEQHAWFQREAEEYRGRGATHFRFSTDTTTPNLCLVEAWKKRPANEGDPRWQLTAA